MSSFIDAVNHINFEKPPPVILMGGCGPFQRNHKTLELEFEEICKNPMLASYCTAHSVEDYNLDAGVLFSSIFFLLNGLGYNISFYPNTINYMPIIQPNDNKKEKTVEFLSFQAEALFQSKRSLANIPLIGTVGGLGTIFKTLKKRLNANTRHKKHEYLGSFCEDAIELYLQQIFLQIHSGIDVLIIYDSHSANQTPEYWNFVQKYVIDVIGQKSGIKIIYYANGTWHHSLRNVACFGMNKKQNVVQSIQNYYGLGGICGTFNQNYLKLPPKRFIKCCNQYIENLSEKTSTVERSSWIHTTGYLIPESALEENIRYFVKKGKEIKNQLPLHIKNEMFAKRQSAYEVFFV